MQVWFRYAPARSVVTDSAIGFRIDEGEWLETSLAYGLSHVAELEPGAHTLATRGTREREWTFEVPADAAEHEALRVEIRFRRGWGTFAKTLDVQLLPQEQVLPDDVRPMHAPEDEVEDLPPCEDRKPIATFVCMGVLAAVFALELALPVAPASGASPAISTLRGLGGLDVQGMHDGQWFRLLTCTFLHADPAHLLCNLAALLLVGFGVEGRLGWRWFLALYAFGALGGSVVSLLANDGHTISVGASGAIMGLFAGGLFVAQTMPRSIRAPFQVSLLRVLIPSLLPLGTGSGIDIGAHLGGALAGAFVAGIVVRRFSRVSREEGGIDRFRQARIPLVASAVFVATSLLGAARVARSALPQARADLLVDQRLIPNEQLSLDGTVSDDLRARWMVEYPHDPRVIVMAIGAADAAGDPAKADALVQEQRASLEQYRSRFPATSFDALVRTTDEAEARSLLVRRLLPATAWPLGSAQEIMDTWQARLAGWLQQYPDDPSVRERAAALAIDRYAQSRRAPDLAEAETHARHGLAHVAEFRSVTSNLEEIEGWLSFVLRQALVVRIAAGDTTSVDEAAAVSRVLCSGTGPASKLAIERKLCPPEPPAPSP